MDFSLYLLYERLLNFLSCLNMRFVIYFFINFIIFEASLAEDFISMSKDFIRLSEEKQEAKYKKMESKLISIDPDSSLQCFMILENGIKNKNSLQYVGTLRNIAAIYSKYLDTGKFDYYFHKAVQIAEKNDFAEEMANLYVIKAEDLKSKFILDSALFFALQSENIYKKTNNQNKEYVAVYHLMGDIYYNLDLMDDAEQSYKIVEKYGKITDFWYQWRSIVIYTNLGNIYTIKSRYDLAFDYYRKAEKQIEENKKLNSSYSTNIQLAHLLYRVAFLYNKQKDYSKAKLYINQSIENLEKEESLKDYYPSIYSLAGLIELNLGDIDKSEFLLTKAIKLMETYKRGAIFETYLTLSNLYEKKNDFERANFYLKMHSKTYQDFKHNTNSSLILKQKVFADIAEITNRLDKERTKVLSLIVIAVLLGTLLILTYYFKQKLNKAYKALVNRTLETIDKNDSEKNQSERIIDFVEHELQSTPPEHVQKVDTNNSELSQELLLLAERIHTKLTTEDHIFNPDFSINDLSRLVNSNRDYVSKAINRRFNVQFQIFINDLRVLAAIKLMNEYKSESYKMEYFMEKVGFSNRATFSNSFKRYAGMTPSSFYKALSEQ